VTRAMAQAHLKVYTVNRLEVRKLRSAGVVRLTVHADNITLELDIPLQAAAEASARIAELVRNAGKRRPAPPS